MAVVGRAQKLQLELIGYKLKIKCECINKVVRMFGLDFYKEH